MIEYSDDKRTAYYMGYKFRRDAKTGYYLANKPTHNGKRERLHVFVWRTHNGEIPDGFHVHHVDEDKGNNEIENLECIPRESHLSLHSKEYVDAHPIEARQRMDQARIKASEWHRSEEGRRWHSKHALEQNRVEREFVCECCGRRFMAYPFGSVKFCSNACKAEARRLSGVDNIERSCIVCGKQFVTNKYSKTVCCSRECAGVLRRDRIHKKRGEGAGV